MNRASSVLSLFAAGVLGLAVVGCTHERPKELPGTAVLAVEGDRTLNYLAPADGMVTVYDARADKTVYSGEIKKGQNVMVDTSNNRITIDGKTVSDSTLFVGHPHRIFFEPSSRVTSTSTVQTNTTSVESKSEVK